MARADAKYSVTLEDRTSKGLRSIQSNLKTVSVGFAALATAGVAVGGGFLALTKRTLENVDALAKAADAAGLSTDKYQEYVDALSFAGITTETFNSVTVAFVKRVGEARNGIGPLVSGLKGVNDELLQGIVNAKNQDEALDLVFEAMGSAADAAERAAIANAAFSRTGVVLGRAVKDGTGALKANMQAARESGRIYEERFMRSAEAANDAMANLQRTIGANFNRALLANADAIKDLADSFNELIPVVVTAASKVAKFFDDLHETETEQTMRQLGNLGLMIGQTAVDVAEYEAQIAGIAASGINRIRIEGMPVFQRLQEARQDLQEMQALRRELEDQIKPMAPAPIVPGPEIEGLQIKTAEEIAAEAAFAEAEKQHAITQEFYAGLMERQRIAEMWVDWDRQEQNKRAQTEAEVQATITSLQQAGASNFAQIQAYLATKSKDWARAMVLVNKGAALVNAYVSTQEAAIKSRTIDPTGALEAQVRLSGRLAMAAIAGAGLASLASINESGRGGGPAASGGSLNPINTAPNLGTQPQESARQVQIVINGNVRADRDFEEFIIDAVRRADDRDVVLISGNGANAQSIRSGF